VKILFLKNIFKNGEEDGLDPTESEKSIRSVEAF